MESGWLKNLNPAMAPLINLLTKMKFNDRQTSIRQKRTDYSVWPTSLIIYTLTTSSLLKLWYVRKELTAQSDQQIKIFQNLQHFVRPSLSRSDQHSKLLFNRLIFSSLHKLTISHNVWNGKFDSAFRCGKRMVQINNY